MDWNVIEKEVGLAKAVRMKRGLLGLTVQDLADMIGVSSKSLISRWELETVKIPVARQCQLRRFINDLPIDE